MYILDPVRNIVKLTIEPIDAVASGITLQEDGGLLLPDPAVDGAYNLYVWNSTDYTSPENDPYYEILRVTGPAGTGDIKYVLRGQEGTSAVAHNITDKQYYVGLDITAKMITDIDTALYARITSVSGQNHATLSNLDYASAGHTGFAGTDVSNIFSTDQQVNGNVYATLFDGIATHLGDVFVNATGTTITAGQPVCVSGVSAYFARADAAGTASVYGLAAAPAADGEYINIVRHGQVNRTSWNGLIVEDGALKRNTTYYLSDSVAGKITGIPPSSGFLVTLGIGKNNLTIYADVQQPIKL